MHGGHGGTTPRRGATRARRVAARVAALVATTLLASCGDGAGPADESALEVVLEGPAAGEGALLLTISGPDSLLELQAVDPGAVVQARRRDGATRVLVLGDLALGPVLRFRPAADSPDRYAAALVQVADREGRLRDDLGPYRLTLRPAE